MRIILILNCIQMKHLNCQWMSMLQMIACLLYNMNVIIILYSGNIIYNTICCKLIYYQYTYRCFSLNNLFIFLHTVHFQTKLRMQQLTVMVLFRKSFSMLKIRNYIQVDRQSEYHGIECNCYMTHKYNN